MKGTSIWCQPSPNQGSFPNRFEPFNFILFSANPAYSKLSSTVIIPVYPKINVMVKFLALPFLAVLTGCALNVSSFTPLTQNFRAIADLRVHTEIHAKENAARRDLRFKGAVNFRPVDETSFFEGNVLSSDPIERGNQLVEAAINVAKKRDPGQTLFIQTVTEIASSLGPLFAGEGGKGARAGGGAKGRLRKRRMSEATAVCQSRLATPSEM